MYSSGLQQVDDDFSNITLVDSQASNKLMYSIIF